ncbi:helix-turn-helix domain-containing protein [Streptomyces mangrovisoli]|uniref:DNA-binding protein n=1 Tax=Streptomyces mangrovisoli TaxID=1428628 RepID=A0A1J4P4J8_9ACTN|nr:pyridoxamine 5'-phosphate oxidase family protein [Streptomyces mangrovisoli]OIJ68692.1 DNA-binding protein [Streptomyces mangrovisoli]
MTARSVPAAPAAPDARTGTLAGDLGRRIAGRRARLGLTRQETAARAAMAPGYLRYLEESPGAAPGRGTLLRLAGALGTSCAELAGGVAERPPGRQRAAREPEFGELTEERCRALLGTHGVGRVAVTTPEGPLVVPVNYGVVDGAVVYRTAPGTVPARAAGHRVAFEVDRVDDTLGASWSVLVRGTARAVAAAEVVRRPTGRPYPEPWAGGRRRLWIRIEPSSVTGRRITTEPVAGPPGDGR